MAAPADDRTAKDPESLSVAGGGGALRSWMRGGLSLLLVLAVGAFLVCYGGEGVRIPTFPTVSLPSWDRLAGFAPLLLLLVVSALGAVRTRRPAPSGGLGILTCGMLLAAGLAVAKALLWMLPPEGLTGRAPDLLLPGLLFVLPVATTCSPRFTLLFLLGLAFLTGFAGPGTPAWRWDLAAVTAGGGLPAVILGSRTHGRSGLILAGVAGGAGISLAGLGTRLVIAGWSPTSGGSLPDGLTAVAAGLPVGLLSGVLVAITLPVIEPLVGRTSNVSLAGLLRLDHPLLLWIRENAPGTYHHSLNVGNLAAAAAPGVGANPLLAQAAGHFHDLGKVRRADHFMENIRGENPHDRLPPRESASIILAHAREGFEIARKKGLPPEVVAITREHQGTTRVEWFYAKADREGTANDADFRYAGPKPQGKEAALVMLADSVEALSRTLENPDRRAFEEAVDFILRKKEAERQLDESGIRRAHLPRIRKALVLGLEDIHHRRVRYPTAPETATESPGTSAPGSPAERRGDTSR